MKSAIDNSLVQPLYSERIVNGVKRIFYNFHAGQARAWASDKRFILVLAGAQSGKTTFGPVWLDREIQKCGPGEYLAISANYPLMDMKMLPEMRSHFEQRLGWQYHGGSIQYFSHYGGKYKIFLRTAKSALESATAKAIWMDECGHPDYSLETWQACRRRIAVNRSRVLMTTTPYDLGWLKVHVFDKCGKDPSYECINFRSIENPAFSVAEYLENQQDMAPWRFNMMFNGIFEAPAGLIYRAYSDSLYPRGHRIKDFMIPTEWPRTLGADFGLVNTALLWIATNPKSDEYVVYREEMGGELSQSEWARRVKDYGDPVTTYLGGSRSEEDHRISWQLAGIPMLLPAIQEVEAGIDHIIALFREKRMFVFDSCTSLRAQLGSYSRKLDSLDQPVEVIADKQKYHMCDALRYGVSRFPLERDLRVEVIHEDLTERQVQTEAFDKRREDRRAGILGGERVIDNIH